MSLGKIDNEKADVYDFDRETQEDILSLMLQDSGFMDAASFWVKPNYFSSPVLRSTASFVLEFYEKYKLAPTAGQAKTEIVRSYRSDSELSEDLRETMELLFSRSVRMKKEYTAEIVGEWAQAQAWKHAIMKAVPFINNREFKKVNELMEEASRIGTQMDAGGYWYFETTEERMRRREDESEKEFKVVPTGIFELDAAIDYGGVCRGEIALAVGRTNGGKSQMLGHMARRGVWEGENVAVFSFEMSEENYADRLDAGFSNVEIRELLHESEQLHDAMEGLSRRFPKKLWLRRFPTKGGTIKDMRQSLEILERRHGWKPGLIVLDYAAIVRPDRFRKERHIELMEILEDFRALCINFEAAGWTAAQTKRDGYQVEWIRADDVAGSWDSLGVCDYIVTINASAEEIRRGEVRLLLEKNRNGLSQVPIGPLRSNWKKMCFAYYDPKAKPPTGTL